MKAMILGAGGLCGTSLVPLMEKLHGDIELFLIDPDEESKPPIIKASPKPEDLWHIIKAFGMGKGDVVIDLAPDLVKLDVLEAADNNGVSVINATCCEHNRGTLGVADLLDPKLLLARYDWQTPHIVDAGMNPGNINALLAALISKAGEMPKDVTQWELDSTIPFKWDGEGFSTWSPEELASEFCDESTWEVDGKKVIFLDGPPIDNKRQMPDGNTGCLCQHEEILNWGRRYGCKARYIYGWTPKALAAIEKNIRAGLEIPLCRKLEGRIPTGGDKIGVVAQFPSGTLSASISAENAWDIVPIGSNATSFLVASGVCTAVEMLKQGLEPKIHWPDDFAEIWIDYLDTKKLADLEGDI